MHKDQIDRIRENLSFWGWSGWKFHNETVCQTYGFQWQDTPNRPIRYVQGYGPADMVDAYLRGAEVGIVHWIGSDVMFALGTGKIPPPGTIHFCDSWDLKIELATLGIDARVVNHRPRNRVENPMPLPETPGLAIYMPPTRHGFFRYDLCNAVASAVRDQGWNVSWHDLTEAELLSGGRDYMGLMARCSHYLRTPIHDGFSHTSAEFIMAGRSVVTTSERPYQYRAKPDVDDILSKLKESPFETAPAYYRWITEEDRLYEEIWSVSGW